jgi:hypothetical protein
MMKKIIQLLGLNLLIGTLTMTAGISFAQPPKYRGYNKCKGCHGKEFESWKEGSMNGESFNALMPGERTEAKIEAGLDPNKDYTSEAKCLVCHATGYGKPGGFVNVADTPDLAGITCEACHGPGEYYWKVMVKKRRTYALANLVEKAFLPPDQGICDQCHTPGCPMESDTYDYDESSGHDNFPLRYEHPRDWKEARR